MIVAEVYKRAGRYGLLCPMLFLLPAAVEMVQHIAEYRLGFYDSLLAMKAAEHAPLRMVLGHLKVLTLFVTAYWAIRFWAFGDDPAAARRLDPRALLLFVPVMLWSLFWLVLLQDGPMLAGALGVAERPVALTVVGVMLVTMFFEVCLAAWKVTAIVGNPAVGFRRSVRLTRGSYWWSLGVSFAAMLPLMVVHYALTALSIGKSAAATLAILGFDSLLVAVLGATMSAANYVIARRVVARAGLPLLPEPSSRVPTGALAA